MPGSAACRRPVLVVTLAATALAMAGTAVAMAAAFVLHRSARTFQNSLSYPFYLLGGAIVPPALLPAWLQPLTKVVFLSRATELLRDSLVGPPVPDPGRRLAVIVLFGMVGYVGGLLLLRGILHRVRHTGEMSYA